MPKNKFNQRHAERKGTIQEKQNNNSLAIKQSQGPLVPSQGLQILSRATSIEMFCRY